MVGGGFSKKAAPPGTAEEAAGTNQEPTTQMVFIW
jgi:hypothetical protein